MRYISLLLLLLTLTACSDDDHAPLSATPGIEPHDTVITLASDAGLQSPSRAAADPVVFEYEIRYTARILPVEFNGVTVQANSIVLGDQYAYVAYNQAGTPFNGALQVLKLSGARPEVVKQYQLPEFEITALYLDGANLYLGGRGNIDAPYSNLSNSRTAVAVIDTGNLPDDAAALLDRFIPLHSGYAVTGISGSETSIFLTTGASAGHFLEFDSSLQLQNTFATNPLRGATVLNNTPWLLYGGTNDQGIYPGGLLRTDGQFYDLGDIGNTESKVTIQAVPYADSNIFSDGSDVLVLGLNTAGCKIEKVTGSSINNVYTLQNPSSDPSHVNNSAVYSDGLLFTANGEYGFRVLMVHGPQQTSNEDNFQVLPGFTSIVGFHKMEGLTYNGMNYSANDIAWNGNFLFVASGAGGVNVYQLQRKQSVTKTSLPAATAAAVDNNYQSDTLTTASFAALHNDGSYPTLSIKLTNDAQVYTVFYKETAGYQNSFGFYSFNSTQPPTTAESVTIQSIFDNSSAAGSGGSLKQGNTHYMGNFPNGTTVEFSLQQGGYKNTSGPKWYSRAAFNSDNRQHFVLTAIDRDNGYLLLGVEDTTDLGDKDFSDLVVLVKIEPFHAVDLSGMPSLP